MTLNKQKTTIESSSTSYKDNSNGSEALTGKEMIETHSDYLAKLSEKLGFDIDFLELKDKDKAK